MFRAGDFPRKDSPNILLLALSISKNIFFLPLEMFFYKKLLGGGNSSNDTLLGKEEFDVEYSDDGTYKLASINIDEGRNRASKSRNTITWKAIHITLSLLNILVLATLIFQTNRPNHGPNLIACEFPLLPTLNSNS
jgi:hypothetical protein